MESSLWLVTPVHGRPDITRFCLTEHRWAISELRARGIDAHELVIGNDTNLDTADQLGLLTLERPNRLGEKINDGIEHACQHGATHVVFCGSDDWVHPDYLAQLPLPDRIRTGRWRAVVTGDGTRLVTMRQQAPAGIAPWIIPRQLLETVRYRPADDNRMRSIDASIARNISRAAIRNLQSIRQIRRQMGSLRRTGPLGLYETCDRHELQRVGFKGGDQQLTVWRWAGIPVPNAHTDTTDVYATLATQYPADLCRQAAAHYQTRRTQQAA